MAKNTIGCIKDHIFELRNKMITMINHRIYIPRTTAVVKVKPEKKTKKTKRHPILCLKPKLNLI